MGAVEATRHVQKHLKFFHHHLPIRQEATVRAAAADTRALRASMLCALAYLKSRSSLQWPLLQRLMIAVPKFLMKSIALPRRLTLKKTAGSFFDGLPMGSLYSAPRRL